MIKCLGNSTIYEIMPEYPVLCTGMNGILFRGVWGRVPPIQINNFPLDAPPCGRGNSLKSKEFIGD